MDYQPPPAIVTIVTIVTTERRDVRAETVEHVARLLVRADGLNPDDDLRCSIDGNPAIGSMTCTLQPYAMPRWHSYREKAEALLKQLFGANVQAR